MIHFKDIHPLTGIQAFTEILDLSRRLSWCKMYVVNSQGWLSRGCWLDRPKSKSWPVTIMALSKALNLSLGFVSFSGKVLSMFLNKPNPWIPSLFSRTCNWHQDFVQSTRSCRGQWHRGSFLLCQRLLYLLVAEWFRPFGGGWHTYNNKCSRQWANYRWSSPYRSAWTHLLHCKKRTGVREERSLQSHCELYVPNHTHTCLV